MGAFLGAIILVVGIGLGVVDIQRAIERHANQITSQCHTRR